MSNYRQALLGPSFPKWQKRIQQGFAIANLAFAAEGFHALNSSLRMAKALPSSFLTRFSNTPQILHVMFIAEGALLVLLTWGSIRLLRGKRSGVRICCLAYILETLYWFKIAPSKYLVLWLDNDHLMNFWVSMIANDPLGKFAILAQMYLLYPLVALFVMAVIFLNTSPPHTETISQVQHRS